MRPHRNDTGKAPVTPIKTVSEEEIHRINRRQRNSFILSLKDVTPFPLDEFPKEPEAGALLKPFGFEIETFIDDPGLYILVATKCRFGDAVDEVE